MQLTTTNQGFAPVTLDEAMRFSDMLAKSQMVPKAYQNKPEDVLVAIQWGRELGLAPLQALQNIACINGKPSVYGDAAMALVQASSVCDGVDETIEGEGTPNPVAVCVARRKGRNPVIVRFSVEDAKRAGLWGKAGPWQAYPKRMLQMRARGFALRDAFPDVLKGLITAEEAADYPDEAKPRERDVTPAKPANPLDAIAPPAPTEDVVELQNAPAESAEPAVLGSWALMVPGKDEPHSVHGNLKEWGAAYDGLADQMCRTSKLPERDRMTKLREFKEANKELFDRMDAVEKLQFGQRYQNRLRSLGAAKEKNPG